jgi:hypothetical protein
MKDCAVPADEEDIEHRLFYPEMYYEKSAADIGPA